MLDWSKFEKVSGAAERNFEVLCRSLVRLRYSAFGEFVELKNQPGLEFHLQLSSDSDSLGKSGQWFGWQCKWFNLKKDGALTVSQKTQIVHSLSETRQHLPHLTDWVLCVRDQLTKADQKWFKDLRGTGKTAFPKRLHLWHSADLEMRLVGEAELLRQTYFGDLILTPENLARQHNISVAPIRQRWFPKCHQPVKEEHEIRRMLGEQGAWEVLHLIADDLKACIPEVKCEPFFKRDPLFAARHTFIITAAAVEQLMRDCHSALSRMDFEELRILLGASRPDINSEHVSALPRRMRNRGLFRQVYATNALDDMRQGFRLLDEVRSLTCETMVAIIAEAGGGKTHLAAQVTAPDERSHRPAGVFFQARDLKHGHDLNSLAAKFTIQGKTVQSMEALLAAVNAAGQRASRRLPLVFDGLNEAEDPRDWKPLLAQLRVRLQQYPYVLCVCTLRSGRREVDDSMWIRSQRNTPTTSWLDFAQQALPDDGVRRLEVAGFGDNTPDAIQKYFDYYNIKVAEPGDDFGVLTHPLTLRIFCDVTNGERRKPVELATIPENLDDILASYADKCATRIAELSPTNSRFCQGDVQFALGCFGNMLWEKSARELDEDEYRKRIKDDTRPWTGSLAQLLEQEGLLLRFPGDSVGTHKLIPVFDRLGGHLIATALLSQSGAFNFETWAKSAKTTKALSWGHEGCQPLASDVFVSLANQVPKRFYGRQFWQAAGNELKSSALLAASRLSNSRLDQATVEKIAEVIGKNYKDFSARFLSSLLRARGIQGHSLNANFLDSVLRRMPMAERDLLWTEWIRHNADKWNTWDRVFDTFADVARLETHWRENLGHRTDADTLRAKWLSWMLTTTIRDLRNRVTRALYWFGRGNAEALFEMTVQAADINDPYVFERLMAASYGVAMALTCIADQREFREKTLPNMARQIFTLMFVPTSIVSTTHSLTREYSRQFLELSQHHNVDLFSKEEVKLIRAPYKGRGRGCSKWPALPAKRGHLWGLNSPFRMDFENYTIGSLVEDRNNYDFNHKQYQKVRSKILWRVQQLGWSCERFEEIDKSIARKDYPTRATNYPGKTDRYGKKYSWIAYHEMRGWLQDQGLQRRLENGTDYRSDVDIDPSFPETRPEFKLLAEDWLGDKDLGTNEWVENAVMPDLTKYLEQRNINGLDGPWVLLDGYFTQNDEVRGRKLFSFVRSFLVQSKRWPYSTSKRFTQNEIARFRSLAALQHQVPSLYYAFSGEIPWCSVFPNAEKVTLDLGNSIPALSLEVPVVSVAWEGEFFDEKRIGGTTLAPSLARVVNLVNIPQSYDLQTVSGDRATLSVRIHDENSRNTEHFLFIKKDILKRLLQKRRLSLFWYVWGERDWSIERIVNNMSADNRQNRRYKDFHSIHLPDF